MSAQSIYNKSIDTLKEKITKDILDQARKFTLYNRFLVGECINNKKRNHALMYSSFVCTSNCDLIEHINKTLKGKALRIRECKKEIICPNRGKGETVYIYINGGYQEDNSKDCSDCMVWENKTW